MTLLPSCISGELLLSADCPRAIGLAKTLCLRRPRRVPTRFYMGVAGAEKFQTLYDAGFEACPRWVHGDLQLRYRRPGGSLMRLHEALAEISLASVPPSGNNA